MEEQETVIGYEIEITEVRSGWKKDKKWNKLYDADPGTPGQYEYLVDVLPFKEERIIYRQFVKELDLREVIYAVNKPGPFYMGKPGEVVERVK